MENLDAFAISSKICDVEASALTVMDSGRFLIGRPEINTVSILLVKKHGNISIPLGRTINVRGDVDIVSCCNNAWIASVGGILGWDN